jgi:hypothetical protein
MSEEQTPQRAALYNPTLALVLALIFTPIFGGLLHALNWKALGNDALCARSMAWVRWTFYCFICYTFLEPIFQTLPFGRYMMLALLVGFWLAWASSIGISQVLYVRDFVPQYERKMFGKAIMAGALGWVGYTTVALTITLILQVSGLQPIPTP